jgi:hypothetical protein
MLRAVFVDDEAHPMGVMGPQAFEHGSAQAAARETEPGSAETRINLTRPHSG